MPKLFARLVMDVMIFSLRSSKFSGRIKDRSIFNVSNGKSLNEARLEKPVPKSSQAKPTPKACNCCNIFAARSGWRMITVSVISIFNVPGCKTSRSNIALTWRNRSCPINCTADTLTDTKNARPRIITRCQIPSWRAAPAKIKWPISPIIPVVSAISINSDGVSKPSSGCRQRAKASKPAISNVAR